MRKQGKPAHVEPLTRRYLRTPAAATFLGAAAQTLERWRTEGTGPPFVRLSSKLIVYDLADLARASRI